MNYLSTVVRVIPESGQDSPQADAVIATRFVKQDMVARRLQSFYSTPCTSLRPDLPPLFSLMM